MTGKAGWKKILIKKLCFCEDDTWNAFQGKACEKLFIPNERRSNAQ